MIALASTVLGLSLVWLVYTYFGYPLLLRILARARQLPAAPAEWPRVTVITAAFNEEDAIGATLANKLELDYPPELLDLIVVSDESSDRTDEIVRSFERDHPGRVRLIRQVPRQGKTSGLNLAAPQATGEILVFADANSIYAPDALRHIVANFADPRVGYVTGKMIYTNADGSVNGDGCTTYMRYENILRDLETRVGSVVGVDGGVDAMRKSLYKQMRADQLPDFVLPLHVVEQGYRVVYEPRAVLREPALSSAAQEYRMRVRVTLRALWALKDYRHLFDPMRYGAFSWQLASHKLLRYWAFVPQFLALVSNVVLVGNGPQFAWLLIAQVAFYMLAALGYWSSRNGLRVPLSMAPYYLVLLNTSCAHAAWKFLRGEKQVLWQPRVG